jgi:hypothetical protein
MKACINSIKACINSAYKSMIERNNSELSISTWMDAWWLRWDSGVW